MAVKDLALRLTPVFASAQADKAIAHQQKALKATQTTMERLNRDATKGLKSQETLWHRLGGAVEGFGRTTLRAMDTALGGINKFQRGLEGAVKSAFNLRNVVMGSAIGAGAFALGRKVLHAGAGDVRNARMLTREFGPGLLRDSVIAQSKGISKAAGIEDDDALVGLLPIARAIRETKVGDRVGGRRIGNQKQLEAVQRAQFETAAQRFKQLAVLNPNMSPEQIGFLLAEAGQGEEGMRGLGRALNLGKASMADIMRDAKKNKSGTGDIVSAMFNRAGYTDAAMGEEQKSFEFQVKQLGTAMETTFGDIGVKAIERINAKLGDGKSLAERWTEVMERNGPTIDKIADGFARIAEGAVTLALKLPEALSFLDRNKELILGVAGAYAGLRVVGGIRNTIGNAFGGIGGKLAQAAGAGSKEAIPVYIVDGPSSTVPSKAGVAGAGARGRGLLGKIGAVAGAAALGYEIGTLADEASGGRLSGGLAKGIGKVTGQADSMAWEESKGVVANRSRLSVAEQNRKKSIDGLVAAGMARGDAIYAYDNPGSPAAQAAGKKAGLSLTMPISIGSIGGAFTPSTAAATVKQLLPHIEEQLTRGLMAKVPARAGGE